MTLRVPPRLLAPRGGVWMLLTVVGWLLLIPAGVGLVWYFATPGSATTLAPAALAFYLMAFAFLTFVAHALARRWVGLGISVAVLAVLVVTAAPLFSSADAPANARDVVVMTANLRLGQGDAGDTVRAARDHRVDVLMVEELTNDLQDRLHDAGLDRALPHRITEPEDGGGVGTGLWSRYPLRRVDGVSLTFRSVTARVQMPGLPMQPVLVALHLAGPVPDASNWSRDMDVLPGQLARLPRDVPVLVGGDFNATPSVDRFRDLLDNGYEDAGEQAGAGLLRTYPSNRWFPPVLGIDHVLTRGAVGRDADTVQIGGSDHRALVVTVAVPRTS